MALSVRHHADSSPIEEHICLPRRARDCSPWGCSAWLASFESRVISAARSQRGAMNGCRFVDPPTIDHSRQPYHATMPLKDFPDHHDAELVLKLYELRREPVMRESRNLINAKFLPTSFDELLAVTKSDHPLNAAFRQCASFWEMTYAMARHGVVHSDFLLESNGEGLVLYSRVEPWLAEYRAQVNPTAFRNAEWVVTKTEVGAALADRFRKRTQAMLEAKR